MGRLIRRLKKYIELFHIHSFSDKKKVQRVLKMHPCFFFFFLNVELKYKSPLVNSVPCVQ